MYPSNSGAWKAFKSDRQTRGLHTSLASETGVFKTGHQAKHSLSLWYGECPGKTTANTASIASTCGLGNGQRTKTSTRYDQCIQQEGNLIKYTHQNAAMPKREKASLSLLPSSSTGRHWTSWSKAHWLTNSVSFFLEEHCSCPHVTRIHLELKRLIHLWNCKDRRWAKASIWCSQKQVDNVHPTHHRKSQHRPSKQRIPETQTPLG